MATRVTSPQDLQFSLMRQATFNEFDGDRIADSLVEHSDLWEGWILDRAAYRAEYSRKGLMEKVEANGNKPIEGQLPIEPIDLIRLRDIGAGHWNVDTLFILPREGKATELELLARRDWYADEIDWVDGQDCRQPVLRVWWD